MMTEIPPRSGTAFILRAGQSLTVVDPLGEQVADLVCFNLHDRAETLSSGRTLDYEAGLYLSTGNRIWSNRSRVMLDIDYDDCGRHDFLLTPCSADTFRILYGHDQPHRGCFGNLAAALAPYGVDSDHIPVSFNIFMNVTIDAGSGNLTVSPPLSGPGDKIVLTAAMDLLVGLTACSAEQSNNYAFKPIHYGIGPV